VPLSTTGGTWRRIKEHKVLQWSLAYLSTALALAHGQELLGTTYHWPEVIARIVIGVLVIGLPVVVTLAWYHGHKGMSRLSAGEMTVISLLLAIGAGVLIGLVRSPAEPATKPAAPQASVAALQPVASSQTGAAAPAASVAVVPFANLTGEPSKEYFSDGMAEELINELTRVPGLRVPARTSSFAYKGRNVDIRQIARDLGVATILEGSVRSAGERIRITAQLVNAQTGYHLWSQTYDRQFGDVFQLQDELAGAIVQALRASMSAELPPSVAPAAAPTQDPEAYRLYLQAASADTSPAALSLLDQAIARDSTFARAIAAKASVYIDSLRGGVPLPDPLGNGKRFATEALAVAPGLAEGHGALATISAFRGEWARAESEYREAVRLEAGNALLYISRAADLQLSTGHVRSALDDVRTAYALAPGDANVVITVAATYSLIGADPEALRFADVASQLTPRATEHPLLSIVYANADLRAGRYAEAASRTVSAAMPPQMHSASGAQTIAETFAAFGDAAKRPQASRALTMLVEHLSPDTLEVMTRKNVLFWYVELGDLDSAFRLANQSLDEFARQGTVGTAWGVLWVPEMRPFRRDGRFQAFARRLKLFDYWQRYGAPDDCDLSGDKVVCR
jgi:TolB-like protein